MAFKNDEESADREIPVAVSDRELERRWKITRRAMTDAGIDLLICEGGYPGGYVRWLSNRLDRHEASMVAFPIEGNLYYASHGDKIHHKAKDSYGVLELVSCSQRNLLANTQAPLILDILKSKRPKKVGFLGMGLIHASTYSSIVKAMPDVEFTDATDIVVPLKAVKSDEEMNFVKHTAKIHDRAVEILRDLVKVGKSGNDVVREVQKELFLSGVESQQVMAGSSPRGSVCKYEGPSSRKLKESDQFAMLIECSGPGGFFNEVLPTVSLGRATSELQSAFDDAVQAQEAIVDRIRPGADPMELLKAGNEFLVEKGYPSEERLAGHAQGYDLVERPALSPLGETVKLEVGMVLAIHPTAHANNAWGFCPAQNFLVTETGAKKLQETPQEIIEV